MSDYIERLVEEERELGDKMTKLSMFLSCGARDKLNPHKRFQLHNQLQAMSQYREILTERLFDAGVVGLNTLKRLPCNGANGYIHGGPGDGEIITSNNEQIELGENYNQPVSFDPSRPVPEKMWLITYRKKEWGLNDYRWYEWYVEHDPREEEKPPSI